MNYRILSPQYIEIGKTLKEEKGFSKRMILSYFRSKGLEVGLTTVYENIYKPPKRDRREYLRNYFKTQYRKPVCVPCAKCEICLTKSLEEGLRIPINYQVGEKCVTCYLRERGHDYLDLYKSK